MPSTRNRGPVSRASKAAVERFGGVLSELESAQTFSSWVEYLTCDTLPYVAAHVRGASRPIWSLERAAKAVVCRPRSTGCIGESLTWSVFKRAGAEPTNWQRGIDILVASKLQPLKIEVKTSVGSTNPRSRFTASVRPSQLVDANELWLWYLNTESGNFRWELAAIPVDKLLDACRQHLPKQWDKGANLMFSWSHRSRSGMGKFVLDHRVDDIAQYVERTIASYRCVT